MKKEITTLAELEREQKKLRMLMKISKNEFIRSITMNREQAKEYLVKKVMLPVGAVSLGVVAARKMTADPEGQQTDSDTRPDDKLQQLIALGVELFQVYFMQKQQKDINEIKNNQEENLEQHV